MSDSEYSPKNIEEQLQLRRNQQEYQTTAYRDVVTRWLAWGLLTVLVASLVAHYIVMTIFAARGDMAVVESLQTIFHAWLPVLASLVGAVVGYYFGEKK
jgi:hypothetical protein